MIWKPLQIGVAFCFIDIGLNFSKLWKQILPWLVIADCIVEHARVIKKADARDAQGMTRLPGAK